MDGLVYAENIYVVYHGGFCFILLRFFTILHVSCTDVVIRSVGREMRLPKKLYFPSLGSYVSLLPCLDTKFAGWRMSIDLRASSDFRKTQYGSDICSLPLL